MSYWLLILAATIVGGLSDADVIIANETGLPIARIEIDNYKIEATPGVPQHGGGKILVSVSPTKHDLKVVFRGGAVVKWPHLDFSGVHEIYFQRGNQNNFEIRIQ
jgi:hypothetical protein